MTVVNPVFQSIQFFNRCIFSIDPVFQSMHCSIDAVFQSIQFFNQCRFSIGTDFQFFQSFQFFNRSFFFNQCRFQSIRFFNRSIFSIDPVFQLIQFFNRCRFSIDPVFQSMHCSIDAVFCKAIFQSMYRLKIYWWYRQISLIHWRIGEVIDGFYRPIFVTIFYPKFTP